MTTSKPPAGPVTNLLEVEGDNALRHLAAIHEFSDREKKMSDQVIDPDSSDPHSSDIRLKVNELELVALLVQIIVGVDELLDPSDLLIKAQSRARAILRSSHE